MDNGLFAVSQNGRKFLGRNRNKWKIKEKAGIGAFIFLRKIKMKNGRCYNENKKILRNSKCNMNSLK